MKTLQWGIVLNVQNQYKDIAQDNKTETNTMLQMIHTLTTSGESKNKANNISQSVSSFYQGYLESVCSIGSKHCFNLVQKNKSKINLVFYLFFCVTSVTYD